MAAETGESRRRRLVRRVAARVVVVLVVLAALAAAFLLWRNHDASPSPELAVGTPGGPGGSAQPLAVTAVVIEPTSVPFAPTHLGRTHALRLVEIRARVNGFLEERLFEEGRQVEEGQVLYRIDPQPFEAGVAVARARLETAEARLASASRQVQRLRDAARGMAASPSELDQLETEAQVAEAEVRLERARLLQAELDLSYTTIRAPITGLIGISLQEVGSYVGPGQDSLLATVRQVDPIYVEFSVSERDILRWQRMVAAGEVRVPDEEGLPIAVELADGRRYPHRGRISFMGVEVDRSTGTAMVRAVVPNAEGDLLPGQFVRATVMGIDRPGTLLAPKEAVMQSPAGSAVYVVGPEGTAELRTVELGEWHKGGWVVREGLRAGDVVIIDRLMQLKPGMPVRAEVRAARGERAGAPAAAGATER